MTGWKRLSRKVIYETKFLRLYEDTVQLPGGDIIDNYSVVSTGDSVVVVATDENDNVLLFPEYKYPIDQEILCFPAGGIDSDESPINAAKRELREETGYDSDDIEILGESYDYPSKVQHKDYIVRIRNVRKMTDITHEATESIGELILTPISDINELWRSGKFKSTHMASALAYAFPEQLVRG
jgi:ADP-ribose pyrophosphatase|tara:strand:+ start:323 stop:871 length:549 start_codon:yes stop_codon:yes gene_type:complete